MRQKIIDLDERDFLRAGESRFTLLDATNTGYESRKKTAACDEALEFASHIHPVSGKRILLVSALGAFEVWGDNRKGDAFPYNALMGDWPKDVARSFFSRLSYRIPAMWGYKCFPSQFDSSGIQIGGGNTFYEHVNRVPKDLMGRPVNMHDPRDPRCGYILASFYNKKMDRCEVIQEIWEEKLPNIVEAVDRGELPGSSMACDIPFDRCHECGNLAVTERDYCTHLNRQSMRRGSVLPSGRAAVMINDFPVFFDNSIVAKKAAVEAGTLMKVAKDEENEEYQLSKLPKLSKLKQPKVPKPEDEEDEEETEKSANINCGLLQSMRMNEPAFPQRILEALKQLPLNKLFSYLAMLGIVPTGEDLMGLVYGDYGPPARLLGRSVESMLPGVVGRKMTIIVRKLPAIMKSASEECAFDYAEFQKVASLVEPFMVQKSFLLPYFMGRHKQASIVDMHPRQTVMNDRVKAILVLRMLGDPISRDSINVLMKNPGLMQSILRSGLIAEDIQPRLIPAYNYGGHSRLDVLYDH